MTDLFAGLTLAASILAPALQPRSDWVGETVFIKRPDVVVGRLEADGTFTPSRESASIEFVVRKEEKGYVEVVQQGKRVWVAKDDLVRQKDAVEYYTKQLDAEPDEDRWFAFRGWARYRQGKTDEALKEYPEAIRLSPQAASWWGNARLIHKRA